jgi:hypothetical protein
LELLVDFGILGMWEERVDVVAGHLEWLIW